MKSETILETLIQEATSTQLQYDSIKNISLSKICGSNVRATNNMKRNGFTDSLKLVKWLNCNNDNKEFKFFTIPGVGVKTYEAMIPELEIYCGLTFPDYIKNGLYNHVRWCRKQAEYKYSKEQMQNEVSSYGKLVI